MQMPNSSAFFAYCKLFSPIVGIQKTSSSCCFKEGGSLGKEGEEKEEVDVTIHKMKKYHNAMGPEEFFPLSLFITLLYMLMPYVILGQRYLYIIN